MDDRNNPERVSEKILNNKPATPMSAIVLYGGNSCGKSSTLQHLAVLLCGGGILKTNIQNAFETAFYDSNHKFYRDFDIVVNYHAENGKNVVVYISTDGDSWYMVEDNFRFFYHCIRKRHKVYKFDGNGFVQIDQDELVKLERPAICITPANFTQFGGIQAAHYYLDLSCEDWSHNCWIRKKHCDNPGPPVPGYTFPKHKRIMEEDDRMARELLKLINQLS